MTEGVKRAGLVTKCPKCFAYVSNAKQHRRWHKRNKPIPGPPGPPGPQGAMGMTGMDRVMPTDEGHAAPTAAGAPSEKPGGIR